MTEVPPVGAAATLAGPRVELHFPTGVVVVPAGSEAVIGRRGTHGSDRVLRDLDQVSRIHAVVRVAADGSAQIRDACSTNGTFLDAERVDGDWHLLTHGSRLRLGEDVLSDVQYQE